MDKPVELEDRLIDFAVRIINVVEAMPRPVITSQDKFALVSDVDGSQHGRLVDTSAVSTPLSGLQRLDAGGSSVVGCVESDGADDHDSRSSRLRALLISKLRQA